MSLVFRILNNILGLISYNAKAYNLGRKMARKGLGAGSRFSGMYVSCPKGTTNMVGGLRIDGMPYLAAVDKRMAKSFYGLWSQGGGFVAKEILSGFEDESIRLIEKEARKKFPIRIAHVRCNEWSGIKRKAYFLKGKEITYEKVVKMATS